MNVQLPVAQNAIGTITGKDGNGVVRALGSLSLSIDKPGVAFLAPYSTGGNGPNGYCVVPANRGQVGTQVVTVTATATDVDGNALPPQTEVFDVVGAPPPPLAQTVNFAAPTVGGFFGIPSSGAATITLI